MKRRPQNRAEYIEAFLLRLLILCVVLAIVVPQKWAHISFATVAGLIAIFLFTRREESKS
jgi:hypothetical protein